MITYKLLSKEGNRENNEDAVGVITHENGSLFVLCDGLGGHGKGEVASQKVVDVICGLYKDQEEKESAQKALETETDTFLEQAVLQAQEEVRHLQGTDRTLADMKTTVVVLELQGEQAQWCHVGDSRLYYFQKKHYKQRTLDHSVPQMLVSAGEIKEKAIRNHPDRNRLLRVVGMPWEKPRYELSERISLNAKQHQAFLLCSDGFWELITEKEMCKCLKQADTVAAWIDSMEELVRQHGTGVNMDNYSAIGVWVDVD